MLCYVQLIVGREKQELVGSLAELNYPSILHSKLMLYRFVLVTSIYCSHSGVVGSVNYPWILHEKLMLYRFVLVTSIYYSHSGVVGSLH
jgi:hypothetical protein